ncbi:hypothetical protein QBC46DRAFT_98809 [Diplogelasinospora grovesii]|uniref:Arrestin C-terminal-like domain-containing protein n=1 Tax=Diplogelasinospora grovesii TaxID=303347 RepID=A0AAN6NAI8_9PEZI|nr:hypothetical protein QBC46DRAFT_98809 [Diplogelasinospora grovesii]
MPKHSFNPFASVTGKHAVSYFEIRLDNEFIVFRGNEHESSGQLLKGTVVLCLPSPLKIEDVHLRLTGTLHLNWTDTKVTPTGISNQRVDKTTTIYSHRWEPFTRAVTLPAGNYEWPFELMLPGTMTESIEGLHEANITYKLKATLARGKFAKDIPAYKRLRIIRTLESSALEFLHAMSVENIWPNKVEYSIVIPQKAIVFGSAIPVETRFTPLLKGLELGDITVKLFEVHDIILQSYSGHTLREHKKEREVVTWTIPMNREEHWQDMIEDTGQEGWVMSTSLDLPKKLGRCLQDANAQGIKIRHKLKMTVALKNPDGHVSELRATLPVTIFISPNMPLDEDGNLVRQAPQGPGAAVGDLHSIAPPGYGEHVLDQLYDEMLSTPSGLQTPAPQSGMSSPLYGHSRAGSAENLAGMVNSSMAVTPAALSSRLQSMSLDPSHRNNSWHSMSAPVASGGGGSGGATPHHPDHDSGHLSIFQSPPQSAPLSRQNSDERSSGVNTPEHVDYPEMSVLSKVPSYHTAVKTPVRPLNSSEGFALPDYQTAMSAPASPSPEETHTADPLGTILEAPQEPRSREPSPNGRRSTFPRRRQTSLGFTLSHFHQNHGDSDERRRLHLLQAREHVA